MDASSTLLIGNGWLVSHSEQLPLLKSGCVAVCGEHIAEIGATADLRMRYPGAQLIDARGGLIMPGLINTHMHLYSTFARGIALKDAAPSNFNQILERLWWRLDRLLTLEDVYLSALVAMIDCIRNGTTTILDHHSSPGAVEGSLFRIADAARLVGIRSCLCYEVSDRDGSRVADQGIAENRAFLESCNHAPGGSLRALFGLHASFTVTDATLDRCTRAATELDAGFHVHVAEAESDQEHCLREHGKRVVKRFHDHGVLGPRTVAAHCVHVDDREIDLLQSSNTLVVHNPESNMGNAVGCTPVLDMMRRGVRVGLGTDAYTSDMFESLKVANLLHKHQSGQPSAAWAEPPAMLFENNAAAASQCFGRPVGKLVPGALADIVVADYDPPTPLTGANIAGHLLFGVSGRSVNTTIVAGRILMKDRELLHLDCAQVMASAREAAAKLWKRFASGPTMSMSKPA
jgi:putative selenium metabolism protein SsnA